MTRTVIGTYKNETQLKNIKEELIAKGIPREKFFQDKAKQIFAVDVPAVSAPEIKELFEREGLELTT